MLRKRARRSRSTLNGWGSSKVERDLRARLRRKGIAL